jgi:hypothetical protein
LGQVGDRGSDSTTEEVYIPDFPESDDEEEPEPGLNNADGEPLNEVEIAAQAVAREQAAHARREAKRRAREKLILKLREGAFEARRKAMETQRANERTAGAVYGENVTCFAEQSERRRGL